MSTNIVILQGALGADAEVKTMPKGGFVMNLRIPTSESWIKDGAKQERTDWHNCTQFFREEPKIAPYLTKGKAIIVTGKLRNESYEKDGEKKYKTYVQIERVDFVTGQSGKQGGGDSGDAGGGGRSESRGSGGGYAKSGGGSKGNSRPAQTSIPIDDNAGGGFDNESEIPF